MKNFKLSACALLSVIALTFTSCLDSDGDNTTYVYGTGRATSSTAVILDNGLTVRSSSMSLTSGDRVYIYGTTTEAEYEAATATGGSGSVTLSSIYSGGIFTDAELETNIDYDTEITSYTATEVDDISWFTWGSFGNGYMNFSVDAPYYYVTSNSTSTVIEPECYLLLKSLDTTNKTLELVFVYNSRKSECIDTDGDLKDNYYEGSGEVPVSVDVNSLYYEMTGAGLSDTDSIDLSITFVSDENYNIGDTELDGKMGYSTNYFTVSMLKRYY